MFEFGGTRSIGRVFIVAQDLRDVFGENLIKNNPPDIVQQTGNKGRFRFRHFRCQGQMPGEDSRSHAVAPDEIDIEVC